MLKLKSLRITGSIILLYCLTMSNALALNWYQVTSVNNDRSGKIKLTYWEESSKIKESDLYLSLPFTQDKIRSVYASDNNTIENISVSKNNPETTYVNIIIAFKDILKINTAPGFSKVKPTWYIAEDSTTLLYQFEKNDEFAKINSAIYTFELPTKHILRSSGIKIKDNSFSVKVNAQTFTTGTTIFAVFKNSDGKSASDQNIDEEKNTKEIEKDNKLQKKGCGVFSIELPILLGMGYLFRRRYIRK